MDEEIHIVESLNDPNTYFIFREKGIEVKVVIHNNYILPTRNLFTNERLFIRENILEIGYKIQYGAE